MYSAAAHNAVHMRMERKLLSPGVENRSESDFGAKILRIFTQRKQGVRRSLEEELEDTRPMAHSQSGELMRQGKHYVVVRCWQ